MLFFWGGFSSRRRSEFGAGDVLSSLEVAIQRRENESNDLFTRPLHLLMIEHMFENDWHSETRLATPSLSPAGVAGSAGVGSQACSPSEAAFLQFAAAVSALAVTGVSADAETLVSLRTQIDQLSGLLSEAEVRFDQHELWRDEGAGSLRGWLSAACDLSRKEATRQARRTERLGVWPAVARAWSEGRLSSSQVDLAVALVPRRFTALFGAQAAEVVAIVQPLDAEQSEVALRQWVRCAEASDGPEQFRDHPSDLYLDRSLDGRVIVQGQLDAGEAAIVEAALRVFDVPDQVDEHGELLGEARTVGKRNADALVEVCRFALAHRDGAGESGRFVPHVSLVVDVNELRASALRGVGVRSHADLAELSNEKGWSAVEHAWFTDALGRHGVGVTSEGSELDATAVRLLTCDSVVQRVMVAGSRVLNMGREVRTATSVQRRAIIARDRHCRAPGCRTKPKHCDVHHVDHWINGGRTDVDRMVLLCGTHHHEFHKPGYRMELDDQAVFTVHSAKGWSRSSVPERVETQVFGRTVA